MIHSFLFIPCESIETSKKGRSEGKGDKLSGIKKKKRFWATTVTNQERSILAYIIGFSYMTKNLAEGGARKFVHKI